MRPGTPAPTHQRLHDLVFPPRILPLASITPLSTASEATLGTSMSLDEGRGRPLQTNNILADEVVFAF